MRHSYVPTITITPSVTLLKFVDHISDRGANVYSEYNGTYLLILEKLCRLLCSPPRPLPPYMQTLSTRSCYFQHHPRDMSQLIICNLCKESIEPIPKEHTNID